jgi:VWFA-related protein
MDAPAFPAKPGGLAITSLCELIMTHYRFSRVATVCFILIFLHLPYSAGQDVPEAPETENPAEDEPVEPLSIKLSVDEVRLDVVVLDKNGNPITDLTADDFEVFQDDRRQKVLASVYIDNQANTVSRPAVSLKGSLNPPQLPAIALKREDVRRTIVFILDDLEMSFEDGYNAKMALRNFVEKQMQSGDMVAVLQTGYGNSAFQMFLSDKRELLARIDAMRLEMTNGFNPAYLARRSAFALPDILSFSFRTLKDMPGRKFLIMMSPRAANAAPHSDGLISPREIGARFNKTTDDALRAGIVVSLLDIRGLQNYESNYADASVGLASSTIDGRYGGTTDAVLFRFLQLRLGDPTARDRLLVDLSLPAARRTALS